MNFPVGDVIGRGASPFDFVAKARELAQKKFSGYVIIAVRGEFIEEGALFFRDGEISACAVECIGAQVLLKGGDAFSHFLNQTVGKGFFQVVALSRSQVDLVLAFDEKLLMGNIDLKDIPKLIPSAFSARFFKAEGQKSALEAYGLGDLK